MNIKLELKQIGDELALLLQETILKMGHVDTGEMLKSMKVTVTENTIKVNGISYFKYVDGRFGIIKQAKKSKEYKDIIAALKKLLAKKFKEQLKRKK